MDQLTRVVALEETRHDLSAYSLSPGIVDTDMQTAIRAADPVSFPERDRFRRFAELGQFNSPSWVGDRILELAFGPAHVPGRPESVTLRIPDQPAASTASRSGLAR